MYFFGTYSTKVLHRVLVIAQSINQRPIISSRADNGRGLILNLVKVITKTPYYMFIAYSNSLLGIQNVSKTED